MTGKGNWSVLVERTDDGRLGVLGWLKPLSGIMWLVGRVLPLLSVVALVGACGGPDRSGTAWGDDAFRSDGERIYFTATSETTGAIDYSGGPDPRGMMMQGRLSCASCHGADARGGVHTMHMEAMDAPNIRWAALSGHDDEHEDAAGGDDHDEDTGYDLDAFRMAVVEGLHPDGSRLSDDMPRWEMSDEDLNDLAEYLRSFPEP